jgi:tetratricopeptide (TPR) repeat protein
MATHGYVEQLCGCLPLAIGMLARQLYHHPAWTVADLAAAVDRLELLATENLSVAAAFDLSYADLTEDQRRLFRRLALHPGTDIDRYAAAALDGTGLADARRGLDALYEQYLLTEPAAGRYRMHDLIREHVRALAGRLDSAGDREQATGRLLDYYQHAAARAQALLARDVPAPAPAPAAGTVPAAVPVLAGREQALAWARAERTSLLACLDQVTAAGQHARVIALTAGLAGLLRYDGPWDEAITRQATAVQAARQIGDRPGQAHALIDLGDVRRLTGDYPGAARDLQEALDISRQIGSPDTEVTALNESGTLSRIRGDLGQARASHHQALDLARQLGIPLEEARALAGLGRCARAAGRTAEAGNRLRQALAILQRIGAAEAADVSAELDALPGTSDPASTSP